MNNTDASKICSIIISVLFRKSLYFTVLFGLPCFQNFYYLRHIHWESTRSRICISRACISYTQHIFNQFSVDNNVHIFGPLSEYTFSCRARGTCHILIYLCRSPMVLIYTKLLKICYKSAEKRQKDIYCKYICLHEYIDEKIVSSSTIYICE